MMHHFVFKILSNEVHQLILFCDSCAGENKNFTVLRFFHHLVVQTKRFDFVKIVFPIRGHSYLECDRNMNLVNCNTYTETPNDWREVLRSSRQKPSPFEIIDCEKEVIFQNWTEYLPSLYPKNASFQTRPIRVLEIRKDLSDFI
ncbi:hypothetical protein ABEB36_002960 [Hypothenemus hampei]|uniref:DUF7869 domain-containing protein n=1 Tax=Hypothenemus hampei TaxID=57062 RepID=A0ABD1F7J6_HYPHA